MHRKLRYSDSQSFNFYHLCYYFSKPEFKNEEGKVLLNFKNEDEQAMRHFTIRALEGLQQLNIDLDLYVLRALHSHEIKGDTAHDPLDRLGNSISTVFDCSYYSGALFKTRTTQSIKTFTIAQRKAELQGVYKFDPCLIDVNGLKIMIIDDIVTTGTTACAIIKAILDEYPSAEIEVFSLGWTPTLNQQEYLVQQMGNTMTFNEPESEYGNDKKAHRADLDFHNGETNISIFPWA